MGAFILLICVVLMLKCIVLSPIMYKNNSSLEDETNSKIKSSILNAVKDRCSCLHAVDTSILYEESNRVDIIQCQNESKIAGSVLCIINSDFMNSVEILNDGTYYVIVKVYWPEQYYYHFRLKNIDGVYKIVSWKIDI